MKVVISALTAIAIAAGVSTSAGAASPGDGYRAYEIKNHYVRKKYKKRYRGYYYHQYWADKLPTGSQAWWQQMDREGRGGRRP